MRTRRLPRSLGVAAVATGALTLAGAAAAPAETGSAAATIRITPSGVDGVKLGATHAALRAKGLVGPMRRGCELAGPNTRAAALRAPLKGSVELTMRAPRRVRTITIRGGTATARGVGVGDTAADIRAAFPKAKFDHSTDDTFRITLVRVPKRGGGRLQFAVGTTSGKVELIGIPAIPFCE